MSYSVQIAVELLSALLTGGFLLFFIETMHIEGDVERRFKSIMNPFYHKLSKLTVFVGYMRNAMTFPETERGACLKIDMDIIEKAGIVPSTSGRDIPFMKAKELESLCNRINDVWYQLDKSAELRQSLVVHDGFGLDIARRAICEVYPKFETRNMDVDSLYEATGVFFVDYWHPVESCTPNYEYWQKQSQLTRVFIYCALGITLLSLIAIMILAEYIGVMIPCSLAVLSSVVFAICLGMMAYLISLSNRLFRAA